MKNVICKTAVSIVFAIYTIAVAAQNNFTAIVKDSVSNTLLQGVGVAVSGTTMGGVTDTAGYVRIGNIPPGKQHIGMTYVGYKKIDIVRVFPLKNAAEPDTFLLSPDAEEMEAIIVSAMRNNSRIEDLPAKIEVLGADDMLEENGIRPGNISSLLGDIAGVQIQQTSASSGNMNARIQGMDGRYSQILADGMPMYGGFSGSFSILQVPPLDLRQIEIMKGSASTLYGGDAIGGIINLVSKKPGAKPETNFLINQTSLQETDLNAFVSRKYEKVGFTLFEGNIYQKAVDVNNDGFSDAPDVKNICIHPKLFFYMGKNANLSVGLKTIVENRKGGDMQVLYADTSPDHQYFVAHKTIRNTASVQFDYTTASGSLLLCKGSLSHVNRSIQNPDYFFKAAQALYYTEVSYMVKHKSADFVFGINTTGDYFKKALSDSLHIQNYTYATIGMFVQNDLRITDKLLIESGFRVDYHTARGRYYLPQLSVLYKFLPQLTARINGGLGYKIPITFSFINEEVDVNRVATLQSKLETETSKGLNIDMNYTGNTVGKMLVTINQSLFYTVLNHPVFSTVSAGNQLLLANAQKPVVSKGLQSYLRLSVHSCELYISYVYTHIEKTYDPVQPYFWATPKHNLSATFTFEPNEQWRFGIENMFVGNQLVENNATTPPYDFLALMMERRFNRMSVVLNCENVFDYRQKNYLIPPVSRPAFKTIWAPIDGRVINLSLHVTL